MAQLFSLFLGRGKRNVSTFLQQLLKCVDPSRVVVRVAVKRERTSGCVVVCVVCRVTTKFVKKK